jgi:hypothetical protein
MNSEQFTTRVFEAIKVDNATHQGTVLRTGKKTKGVFQDPDVGSYSGEGNIPSGSGGEKVSNRKLNVNWRRLQTGKGPKFKL